jgi:hypothetical protein
VPNFSTALGEGFISMHPVVLGELATGNLAKREQTIAMLRPLPFSKVGTAEECLSYIQMHSLYGRGLGWNDVQLLVAARLSGDLLWSLDTRLAEAAVRLGVAYAL